MIRNLNNHPSLDCESSHSFTPSEPEPSNDFYTPFNQQDAIKHIKKLLRHYKIGVKEWSVGSNGRAWVKSKIVKIPIPSDIDRFWIACHEIGHVVKGVDGKLFEYEYIAEMFALEQCKIFNWDYRQPIERARRYVIMNISKGHCRGLNLNSINQEIRNFCDINFDEWKGRKVFVKNWGTASYTEPLLIEFYQ